jgi:hypothetical protein
MPVYISSDHEPVVIVFEGIFVVLFVHQVIVLLRQKLFSMARQKLMRPAFV